MNPTLSSLLPMLPELWLGLAGCLFLLYDGTGPRKKNMLSVFFFGVLAVAGFLVFKTNLGETLHFFVSDVLSRYLKMILLLAVGATGALSFGFSGFLNRKEPFPWGTFFAMLLLASTGLFLLVSSSDFLMILIAIELIGVSSFVLVGFLQENQRSMEGALKYFLTGTFAAGLMVYGISLLYGLTGSTSIVFSSDTLPLFPLTVAFLFILSGFLFKLALAPFHLWAPDVYEGASTPVTAFLSVAPKVAGFGALIRVFSPSALHLSGVLAGVCAVSMTVGNLGALRQNNLKRLLAYSSIAQMGTILVGFVAMGAHGFRSVLVYLTAYLFMNLGLFACVLSLTDDTADDTLGAFNGLSSRSMPLALATTFFLLSLTGIPPFIGFIGKFSLFGAALERGGLAWLVVVAAMNSVVSFAYYFSIVRRVFFVPSDKTGSVRLSGPVLLVLIVALLLTVGWGLFPNTLLYHVSRVL